MIPPDIREWIFPQIANGGDEGAVLHHDCGVDFEFRVAPGTGEQYVVTNRHLQSWRTTLETVAEIAGHNCFSYNTLAAESDGVYHDDDGNTFAILFAPGTFLEHNYVDGQPLLLVISEAECILTGSRSEAGAKLIRQYLPKAVAKRILAIESKWRAWGPTPES